MRVFISYASRDRNRAEEIGKLLIGEGHTVWIDIAGIAGGTNWTQEIRVAVESSEVIIVLISHASEESRWVQAEVLLALTLHKFVIPILIDADANPPVYLAHIQHLNATDLPLSAVFIELIKALRSLENNGVASKPVVQPEQIKQELDKLSQEPLPDRVFIAYARKQRPIAKELAELLHKHTKAVFYDAHIRAGARWRRIIQQTLDDATHLIVIWTSEARDSDEVDREVSYALSQRKYIIPLLSKEIPKLPYHLHGLHYIVLDESLSAIEDDLIAAIEHRSDSEGIWR